MQNYFITTKNDTSIFQDLETLLEEKGNKQKAETLENLRIKPKFREFASDSAYALHMFRELFDEIDLKIQDKSSNVRESVFLYTLEGKREEFYACLEYLVKELKSLYESDSEVQSEEYAVYLRGVLWPYLLSSPIHRRTILKPRGYAGDYDMMRMIYENNFEGDSIFGKFLHKYSMETPSAQCGRNRRVLLKNMIKKHHEGFQEEGPMRIASIACGPAGELADFAKELPESELEFFLLDQDMEALEEAKQDLQAASAKRNKSLPVVFYQDTVFSILKSRDPGKKYGTFDIVYSIGLFDYLEAKVARAMMKKLHQMLKPGGLLIVGNLHKRNPDILYMEYLMDWRLIYRDEDELKDLARDLPAKLSREIMLDETGVQMFLSLR